MVCMNSLMWPRNTSMEVSFVVHANCVRTRRITLQQEPFTVTCSTIVSCPTTMFGPSMEKGIILEDGEEEDDFVPHFEHNYHDAFFVDTAMGEPEEDAKGHIVKDDLG